jgi:hypothetical protein
MRVRLLAVAEAPLADKAKVSSDLATEMDVGVGDYVPGCCDVALLVDQLGRVSARLRFLGTCLDQSES